MTNVRLLAIFFLWFAVQYVSTQTDLTLPSSTSRTLKSSSRILTLPLTGPSSKLAASSLLTKINDRQFPAPLGTSVRESEIAAIFQGVAYGAPTFPSNSTTFSSTSSSGESNSTINTTTATISFMNSLYIPIKSILMVYQAKKEARYIPTPTTSIPDINKVTDNSTLQENGDLKVASYIQHTHNTSGVNRNVANKSIIPTFQEDTVIMSNMLKEHKGSGLILPENGITWSLGAAWWIHVYISAGLFVLVAAASIYCLLRLSLAARMVSHLQYITILVLIFFATILRCIHLFYDPYGINNRLPEFITVVIEEISWPCLTGAVAAIAFSLYQSSRCSGVFSKSSCLPVIILLCTIIHLIVAIAAHLTASLVEGYSFPVRITAQSVAVVWGSTVGFGSLWAVWKTEKSASQYLEHFLSHFNCSATDNFVTSGQSQLSINRSAIFISIAGVAQIMLAALHLYAMLSPATPMDHIWVWWGRVSIARGLELLISVVVLAGIHIFVSKSPLQNQQANSIFSVLTSCKIAKGGCSANVFPVQNEERQFTGSFMNHATKLLDDSADIKILPTNWTYTTPHTNKTAINDSVTANFQLLSNSEQTQSGATFSPSSVLVNDNGFIRFRTQFDLEQPMEEVCNKSPINFHNVSDRLPYTTAQHYSTRTLPNDRDYCRPTCTSLSSLVRTPLRKPIRSQTIHTQRYNPNYHRHHMRSRAMTQIRDKYTWTPVTSTSKYDAQTLDRYRAVSYCNDSIGSLGSNMYSMPHLVSPCQKFSQTDRLSNHLPEFHAMHHHYEENKYLKPMATETVGCGMPPSTWSSFSEICVDNLTDFSSSNDSLNQMPLPFKNCSQIDHSILSLPLSSPQSSYARNFNRYPTPLGILPPMYLPDITPDSDVVLDYSTSAETEEETEKDDRNKSLDLLKLSSNSFDDVLKSQPRAGLLSQFVGSSVTSYGDFLSDAEDASSLSREDSSFPRILGITSASNLSDSKEVSMIHTSSHVLTKNLNLDTSL